MRVVLRYHTPYERASTTTPGYQVFRGNDVYDPDVTGAGHQPLGLDQFFAVYQSAYVSGSKIHVTANLNTDGYAVVAPQILQTGPTYLDTLAERANAKVETANVWNHRVSVVSAGQTLKIMGRPSVNAFDDVLLCSASASPTAQWYWVIGSQATDQSTSMTCAASVLVEYDVTFFQKKALTQS